MEIFHPRFMAGKKPQAGMNGDLSRGDNDSQSKKNCKDGVPLEPR
jgi:hypothetical protein